MEAAIPVAAATAATAGAAAILYTMATTVDPELTATNSDSGPVNEFELD
jgi:hypothetical protein